MPFGPLLDFACEAACGTAASDPRAIPRNASRSAESLNPPIATHLLTIAKKSVAPHGVFMKIPRASLFAAALLAAPSAFAQSEWEHSMLIYLLGAGLDGKSQVGPLETDIDQSFSEILENLDAGIMGSYRARNDTWIHTIDAMYFSLSGDTTRPSGARFGAELDQLIASYDIGYRIGEHFEVLAGARFNDIQADVFVGSPSGTIRGSGEESWVDPYIGVGSTLPFSDTLALILRADVGGFDVGSKLAWQAIARLNWSFSPSFFGTFGYRILDTDYENGSGAKYFKYDVTTSGPGIGFGWRFQ